MKSNFIFCFIYFYIESDSMLQFEFFFTSRRKKIRIYVIKINFFDLNVKLDFFVVER
jgi:hypothetical protein